MEEIEEMPNPFDEVEEVTETLVDESTYGDKEENADKIILELQEKIVLLEKTNEDLKTKLESLTKKQTLNASILMKMATVGLKKFTRRGDLNKVQNDTVKIAEIMKEKDELKEMNDQMLDMLTEKELENEDLNEKFNNFKLEAKMKEDKDAELIKSLQEKISILENSQNENELEEILEEYENQKDSLKKEITTYEKMEKELNSQIEEKDNKIMKLNEEIQRLQFENLNLVDQSNIKDKISEADQLDIRKLEEEIRQNKNEIDDLSIKIKKKDEKIKEMEKEHSDEIEKMEKEIEKYKNNIKNKDNEINKLNTLNTKLTNNNKDLNEYTINKEKQLKEEKEKNEKLEIKLDKKTKELKEMNDYYKKLKTKNEELLAQYQEKIDELTTTKNNLLTQNRELLEQLKQKQKEEEPSTNLADIMDEDNNEENKDNEDNKENKEEKVEKDDKAKDKEIEFYKNENKILNEEINGLKEQLSHQAQDLVELNNMEKNIEKFKIENEDLNKTIKQLNEEIKKLKVQNMKKTFAKTNEDFSGAKKLSGFFRVQTLARKGNLKASNIEKEKALLQKQIDALKRLKEEEKKNYETQLEKLKLDVSMLKVKFLNKQYEDDILLLKYKNTIKAIANQCKVKGIKLSLNLVI